MKTSTPSSSIEDYVKVIYSFTEWQRKPITSTQLAQRLGVANSSVSEMVRKLKDQGLVDHKPYSAVTLTSDGIRLALSMVRRHRLIETFLVQSAGMSWDEVHHEAEAMQHAVSDLLIDRIDAALGHPRHDPHGDPIPPPSGEHVEDWPPALADEAAGGRFRVDRVSDEDSAALRYLAGLGVRPGVVLQVLEREPFGGPLWIEIEGQRRALGTPLARLVHGVARP